MRQILTLLVLFTFACQPSTSQTPAALRNVLITLQPGEKIMYAESCLALSVLNNQVALITRMGNKFYVYDKGQRKGPFDNLEGISISECPEFENTDNKCAIHEVADMGLDQSMININDDGTVTIKLNNKKFGPYQFISQMHTWPDKSGFVAIIMDKEMKSHLVTSEGLSMPLNGDVERIQFSPKSKKFIFALKEREALDMDLMKIDFSKMTQEEMMNFAKKQEEKAKNAPERKSWVYLNGSTKFGPYNLNSFYSNNPGFIKNSDHWIMTVDNVLYIDGNKTREFTNIDLNTCKIWLSADAKRYVIVSYDKVMFSDGKTYNNPLEPSVTEKDGKLTLKWLSLENGKDLVFYSREL